MSCFAVTAPAVAPSPVVHSCSYASSTWESVIQSRKRIVVLLVGIVLCFAVMNLPHHLRMLWLFLSPFPSPLCLVSSPWILSQPISYLLLFLNSAVNPYLYALLSQRFRLAIRSCFRCGAESSGATAPLFRSTASHVFKHSTLHNSPPALSTLNGE